MYIKKFCVLILIMITLIFIVLYPTLTYAEDLDSTFKGADAFVDKGKDDVIINTQQLKSASDYIYRAVLAIAIVLIVIVGLILGIKYITAASEDKAEIKETLIPYVVSTIVIFGAFTIWKIVINVLK